MAQVAPRQDATAEVDRLLEHQLRAWGSVPEYAADWAGMDAADREVFHLEWVGLTESALRELQQLVLATPLTAQQQARYRELQRVVAAQRSTVEWLLSDATAPTPRPRRDSRGAPLRPRST